MTTTKDSPFTENNKKLPFYSSRLLLIILLCALLTGLLPQALLSCIVLACCLLLFGTKQIYLAFPVMLFYYAPLGQLAGMSVYRYFTIIFLLIALAEAKNLKIRKSHILPFFIFAVYCLVVLSPDSIRRAVFACLDVFCVLILIQHYLKKPENLRRFFALFVLVALLAFVTGLITGGTLESWISADGKPIKMIRYLATFEDPNYMGFFFTIAAFALLTLKLFHPKLRAVLIITLYAMMLSTLSITMIVVNAILWPIYIVLTKKLNLKIFIIFLVILAILIGLYFVGVNFPNTPVLGALSLRIQDKLDSLISDNLNEVTTGRTNLTLRHWEYFKSQSFLKMLVGMNASSPLKVSSDLSSVAHNEFVDLLLNIGILGTFVYLSFFLHRLALSVKEYRKEKNTTSLCIAMFKCIWLLYGMTLTMFGDFRFFFFFFL